MTPKLFAELYKGRKVRIRQSSNVRGDMWGMTAELTGDYGEAFVAIHLDKLPPVEIGLPVEQYKTRYFEPDVLDVIDNEPLPLPG